MTWVAEPPEGAIVGRIRLRVIFGDTDAAGIVYYGTFARYFEAGRAELLREHGCSFRSVFERGMNMPVVEMKVRYLVPVRYDDLVDVVTWVSALRGASLTLAQRLEVEGRVTTLAEVRLACTGAEGRPVRLPPELDVLRP